MSELSRERYALLYGPTAGDRIRLADTSLLIEVELVPLAGRRMVPGLQIGGRRLGGVGDVAGVADTEGDAE